MAGGIKVSTQVLTETAGKIRTINVNMDNKLADINANNNGVWGSASLVDVNADVVKLAIVIPQAKAEKPLLAVTLMAAAFSCLFTWVPVLNTVSSGLTIVICTVAAAVLCALLFPLPDQPSQDQREEAAV